MYDILFGELKDELESMGHVDIFRKSFCFGIETSHICLNCSYKNSLKEIEYNMRLRFFDESSCSLNDLFKSYFKEEIVEDFNCICGNKKLKWSQSIVGELPEWMPITLLRFNNKQEKIMQNVKPDESIRINDIQYELKGVLMHQGNSSIHGHNYVFCRTNDNWYKINDSVVNEVSFAHILSENSGSNTVYMLMYQKEKNNR